MTNTLRWIGIGLGTLFGVTIVMLVRSARGATSGAGPTIETDTTSDDAKKLTPDWEDEDFRTLYDTAKKYQANPADVLLVMASESGLKPAATNRNAEGYPVAVGLIQFMSAANDAIGITEGERVEFPKKTVSEQLPYVEKFFEINPWTKTGKPYDSAGTVYGGVFAPGRIVARGTSPETVLFDKSEGSAYSGNIGFDPKDQEGNRKGYITVGDLIEHLRLVAQQPTYRAGLQRLRDATGDSSLSPGLPTG